MSSSFPNGRQHSTGADAGLAWWPLIVLLLATGPAQGLAQGTNRSAGSQHGLLPVETPPRLVERLPAWPNDDPGLPQFALPAGLVSERQTLDGQPLWMEEPPAYLPAYLPVEPLGVAPGEDPLAADSGIKSYKNGFFQKLAFTGTWIPRDGEQSIGWTQWEVALSVGLPAPTIEWPLLVTPGFTVWHTDGPTVPDLPAELYQASLGLTWLPKISDRWRLIISATPGVYSDFEQTDSAAWRITGLGLGVYDWVPNRLQLILGAVYLDRDDFNILPAAGLIWTPNPDVKLELVMPRPRFGLRWDYGPGFENWFYLAGEIGGGTWQIEMSDGSSDRVTIRDFRVLLGYEHKRDGGAGHLLEIGYVLGREIEFRYDPRTFSLDDGLLLRAGIAF